MQWSMVATLPVMLWYKLWYHRYFHRCRRSQSNVGCSHMPQHTVIRCTVSSRGVPVCSGATLKFCACISWLHLVVLSAITAHTSITLLATNQQDIRCACCLVISVFTLQFFFIVSWGLLHALLSTPPLQLHVLWVPNLSTGFASIRVNWFHAFLLLVYCQ